MELLDIKNLARQAHRYQVDQAGRDYFDAHLRPIADGAQVFGEDAIAAAWLHDIIEDTYVTVDGLVAAGVSTEVVAAVESVTRRSDETYKELIGRAAAQPLGRLVKLVDNAWNITSNPGLAQLDLGKASSMLNRRYRPARVRLLEASGLRETSPEVQELQQILDWHHDRLESGHESP